MNSFDVVNPALIDVLLAPSGLIEDGGDTTDVLKQMCGSAARDFPQSLWIEPSDWADKARDNDKYHTWPMNYVDRYTNQNPSHSCTCHSLRANAEAARNRQRGIIFADGPKKDYRYEESSLGSVWLSPLSVYAEANPREWGGANVRQVLEIACRRGFLPETKQPADYRFKHAIHGTTGRGGLNQASGEWLRLSQFPNDWQKTSMLFRPEECIFAAMWEQAVCLVLHGMCYSVGRNGHAVPWAYWNHATQAMGYVDSYDIVRYDSLSTVRSAWQGGFAIATMTTPDSWDNPAGN